MIMHLERFIKGEYVAVLVACVLWRLLSQVLDTGLLSNKHSHVLSGGALSRKETAGKVRNMSHSTSTSMTLHDFWHLARNAFLVHASSKLAVLHLYTGWIQASHTIEVPCPFVSQPNTQTFDRIPKQSQTSHNCSQLITKNRPSGKERRQEAECSKLVIWNSNMTQQDNDMKKSSDFNSSTSRDNDGEADRLEVENELQGMTAGAATGDGGGEHDNRGEECTWTLTEGGQSQNRGDQTTSGNRLSALSAALADPQARPSRPTPIGRRRTFPLRLHTLLSDMEAQGQATTVSWQPHGKCFVVRNTEEFIKLLPQYFNQSKWSSFQRQLNLYEFQRLTTGPDRGGYYHPYFIRGQPMLCQSMTRTKVKGTKIRVPSNSQNEPDFYRQDFLNLPQANLSHMLGYQPPSTGHDRMLNQQVQMVPMATGAMLVPSTNAASSTTNDGAIFQQNAAFTTGQPQLMFSVFPFGNQGYIATPVGYNQTHGHPLPPLNSNNGVWSSVPPAAPPLAADESRISDNSANPGHQQPMPNPVDITDRSSGVASLPSSSQQINHQVESQAGRSSSTGNFPQEIICENPIRLSISSIASLQASLHQSHPNEAFSGGSVSATTSVLDSFAPADPKSDTVDSKPSATTGGSTSVEGSVSSSAAGSKRESEDGKSVQNLLEAAMGKSFGSEGEGTSPTQLDQDFGNFLNRCFDES
jgi:hypothetical protein